MTTAPPSIKQLHRARKAARRRPMPPGLPARAAGRQRRFEARMAAAVAQAQRRLSE